eukprot:365626-Chlamydomonas_euryale.AAC.3
MLITQSNRTSRTHGRHAFSHPLDSRFTRNITNARTHTPTCPSRSHETSWVPCPGVYAPRLECHADASTVMGALRAFQGWDVWVKAGAGEFQATSGRQGAGGKCGVGRGCSAFRVRSDRSKTGRATVKVGKGEARGVNGWEGVQKKGRRSEQEEGTDEEVNYRVEQRKQVAML